MKEHKRIRGGEEAGGSERKKHRKGGQVPTDLIFKILHHLPVKSLLRFRMVDKPWNGWIALNEEGFIEKHLQRQQSNQAGFILREADEIEIAERFAIDSDQGEDEENAYGDQSIISSNTDAANEEQVGDWHYLHEDAEAGEHFEESIFLFGDADVRVGHKIFGPFDPDSVSYRIVNSCNGILCLALCGDPNFPEIVIWNPATKCLNSLTAFHQQLNDSEYENDVSHALGFGFNPITLEYQVVRLISMVRFPSKHDLSLRQRFIIVETCTGDDWSRVGEYDGYQIDAVEDHFSKATVGSSLHWFGSSDNKECIISFDLRATCVQTIPLPPLPTDFHEKVLRSVQDSLVLFVVNSSQNEVSLWSMDRYNTWFFFHSIRHSSSIHVLELVTSESIVLYTGDNELFVYSTPQTSFTALQTPGVNPGLIRDGVRYFETLVPLRRLS